MIQDRFNLFHACLLKMVSLQMENPSPTSAAPKMERLLEFMHGELQGMFLLIVRASLEFFRKGGGFKPMAKVASRSPRLRQNVRNVTWDFMQLIWRHSFTGFHGRQAGLMIPYFLKFDRGLADLYDLHPQRSCLFGNEIQFPLFFADMNLPALILGPYPELSPVVSRIFNVRAALERDQCRAKRPLQLAPIISRLEQQLSAFET